MHGGQSFLCHLDFICTDELELCGAGTVQSGKAAAILETHGPHPVLHKFGFIREIHSRIIS